MKPVRHNSIHAIWLSLFAVCHALAQAPAPVPPPAPTQSYGSPISPGAYLLFGLFALASVGSLFLIFPGLRSRLFFPSLDGFMGNLVGCLPWSRSFRSNPLPLRVRWSVAILAGICLYRILDYLLSGDPIQTYTILTGYLRYRRLSPAVQSLIEPRLCVMVLDASFCIVGLLAFPLLLHRSRGGFLTTLALLASTGMYNILMATTPAMRQYLDYYPAAPSAFALLARPVLTAALSWGMAVMLLCYRHQILGSEWERAPAPTSEVRREYRRAAGMIAIMLPLVWLTGVTLGLAARMTVWWQQGWRSPATTRFILRWDPSVLDPPSSVLAGRAAWGVEDVAQVDGCQDLALAFHRHSQRYRCFWTGRDASRYALAAAVRGGRESNVLYLLSRPSLRPHRDEALIAAFRYHRPWLAPVIVEGIDLDAMDPIRERTLLMHAAFKGNCRAVEFLVLQGADPFVTDAGGRNALWFACVAGRSSAARILIAHGLSPRQRDGQGRTLIHVASAQEHCYYRCSTSDRELKELLDLLVAGGVDMNSPDAASMTALDTSDWSSRELLESMGAKSGTLLSAGP